IPVIEKIIEQKPEAVISIDTTKSLVAKEALNAGAKIVNDISGGTFDKNILRIVSDFNAAFVIMHIKGTPKSMQQNPYYDDVVSEVYDYLSERVEEADKAGIKNIFIDPGIGFGKRIQDNYELLKRLDEFKSIGYPILIGLSRKSFIGKTLSKNVDERDNPTAIAETIAVKNGARIVRTHNVKNAVEAKKIINFVNNPEQFIND
ncbi:MAG: dihydropteroate synthase, partial [Melioribacteraceae bacterium]